MFSHKFNSVVSHKGAEKGYFCVAGIGADGRITLDKCAHLSAI